jgi:hypothetical protein
MEQLSLAIRTFNDRVKAMNQTNGKQLVLSAQEAKSLHTDIYALLANIAELAAQGGGVKDDVIQISVDGGGFK